MSKSFNGRGKRCVAYGCGNTNQDLVSLHHFPFHDPVYLKKWIKFVRQKRAQWAGPSEYSVLCCKHFDEDSYPMKFRLMESFGISDHTNNWKGRVLKKTAVPTIHFPNMEKMSQSNPCDDTHSVKKENEQEYSSGSKTMDQALQPNCSMTRSRTKKNEADCVTKQKDKDSSLLRKKRKQEVRPTSEKSEMKKSTLGYKYNPRSRKVPRLSEYSSDEDDITCIYMNPNSSKPKRGMLHLNPDGFSQGVRLSCQYPENMRIQNDESETGSLGAASPDMHVYAVKVGENTVMLSVPSEIPTRQDQSQSSEFKPTLSENEAESKGQYSNDSCEGGSQGQFTGYESVNDRQNSTDQPEQSEVSGQPKERLQETKSSRIVLFHSDFVVYRQDPASPYTEDAHKESYDHSEASEYTQNGQIKIEPLETNQQYSENTDTTVEQNLIISSKEINDQLEKNGHVEEGREIKVEPCEINTNPSEVKIEPLEIDIEPSEIMTENCEINTEPSEMKVGPYEINTQPSEIKVEPCGVNIEPSEIKIEPYEINTDPLEIKVEPCEINTEPSEIDVEPWGIYTEPSEMKIGPYEINTEPSEIKVEPCRINTEPSEIDVEPWGIYTEPSEMKIGPYEINTEPSEIKVEPCRINTEPSEIDAAPCGINTEPSEIDVAPCGINTEPSEIDVAPCGIDTEPSEMKTEPFGINTVPSEKDVEPCGINTEPSEILVEPCKIDTENYEFSAGVKNQNVIGSREGHMYPDQLERNDSTEVRDMQIESDPSQTESQPSEYKEEKTDMGESYECCNNQPKRSDDTTEISEQVTKPPQISQEHREKSEVSEQPCNKITKGCKRREQKLNYTDNGFSGRKHLSQQLSDLEKINFHSPATSETEKVSFVPATIGEVFIFKLLSQVTLEKKANQIITFRDKCSAMKYKFHLLRNAESVSTSQDRNVESQETSTLQGKSIFCESALDDLLYDLRCSSCTCLADPDRSQAQMLDDTMLHVTIFCTRRHKITSWIWYIQNVG